MSNSSSEDMQELKTKVAILGDRIAEMSSTIKDMAESMRKLILLEERQLQDRLAMGRAFDRLDKVESKTAENSEKINEIAKESWKNTRWVDMAVTGIVTAAAIFVAKKIGLM